MVDVDALGLKLRKLKKLNRESKARILGQNISKLYENNHIVKNLEAVFTEIDRIRQTPYYYVYPERY